MTLVLPFGTLKTRPSYALKHWAHNEALQTTKCTPWIVGTYNITLTTDDPAAVRRKINMGMILCTLHQREVLDELQCRWTIWYVQPEAHTMLI